MSMNQVKTVLLLGILTAILLFIGSFFGRGGLTIAIIIVLGMNLFSFFLSHKFILKMYKAKEIKREDNPELHQMVEDLARDAGLPKPKVYLVPSQNANAFATGPSPKKAVIAVTVGLLNLLNKEELKGVLAHEMAHNKNKDILIATIAATIAGIISYVAMMARWAAIFGGFGGRDNQGGNNILGFLVLAILAPILALIIRLAISRSREYLADETGAKLAHSSNGLISALEKLHSDVKVHPMKMGSEVTSHLFIVNPFKGGFVNLFQTHPAVELRIKKLKELMI